MEHLFLVVVGGVVRLTLLIHAVRLLGKEVVQRLDKNKYIFFFGKYFFYKKFTFGRIQVILGKLQIHL